jgi:type IV fimbrial biogenesis protein FimT
MTFQRGFTLIELLITMSIVAMLMTVAIPSMVQFMTDSRMAGYATDVMSALNLARSEAVKRGQTVSYCQSSDGATCGGTSWDSGALVFVDVDGDGTVDAGDVPIRAFSAISDPYDVRGILSGGSTYISFARNGTANMTGRFTFCRGTAVARSQVIIITLTRLRIATDTDNDGIPNLDDGTDLSTCT